LKEYRKFGFYELFYRDHKNCTRFIDIYPSGENKITLGSDYEPFYLHELAHAIDHILPDEIAEPSLHQKLFKYTNFSR